MSKKTTETKSAETVVKTAEPTFSKKQLVNSSRFRHRRYVLDAYLDDDKKYTIKEAEKILDKFSKEEK